MIGRRREKQYLQSLLHEDEPQFIAVYGRRRIGKTYLVRESFGYSFTFQHTGISNSSIKKGTRKQAQLDKFAESLKEAGCSLEGDLTSWEEAFARLKEVIKQAGSGKKVIFIDELSWMDTRDSGLLSALESFWNGWATARKEKDIILIVCASATYWILDNIVNAKGGFHNRLTGKIHLQPFTLGECEEYLASKQILMNRHQILQCYMVLGGVPYYWSLLKKGKSLPQNIDALFFLEGAALENEYDNLYEALFQKPTQYLKIIEALSAVEKGVRREEISRKTGIAGSGDLSKKLTELENCGFIRKYIPFGYKERNALYQLIDNYTLFYHRFVKKHRHEEGYFTSILDSSLLRVWSGLAFEKVCLLHLPQIKAALGIAGVQTETNAWQCDFDEEKGVYGSQIDLLLVRRDQIINICEMKYAESDYTVRADLIRSMRRKISDFRIMTKTRHALHATLITAYGVTANANAGEFQAVITAEELFR